jgi:hypothetical protein
LKATGIDAEAAFTALFADRSGSDRVRMACAMFETAKSLVSADLLAQAPGLTTAELRARMFDRLYFGDFDTGTRSRLVAALFTD